MFSFTTQALAFWLAADGNCCFIMSPASAKWQDSPCIGPTWARWRESGSWGGYSKECRCHWEIRPGGWPVHPPGTCSWVGQEDGRTPSHSRPNICVQTSETFSLIWYHLYIELLIDDRHGLELLVPGLGAGAEVAAGHHHGLQHQPVLHWAPRELVICLLIEHQQTFELGIL